MSHRWLWRLVVAAALAVLAGISLVACGGGDNFAGTWIGLSVKAGEGQRGKLVITTANEGWWRVATGPDDDDPTYVIKIGDELQSGNGVMRLTVKDDTLKVNLSYLDNPIVFTRQ